MRQKVMSRIAHVQITTTFIKTILESPYKVLLSPYILVIPTRLVFFFNGCWVLRNFWHLDCHNFCDSLRKNVKLYFLEASLVSENTPKIISIGPPIMEKQPFKKLKILAFLASFISKTKRADIFNFSSIKYFGKGLSFLKSWHIWVNYC